MERIEVLINKLKEQCDAKAAPGQMLLTLQVLQKELLQLQMNGAGAYDRSRVAVVLPQTKEVSAPAGRPDTNTPDEGTGMYADYQPASAAKANPAGKEPAGDRSAPAKKDQYDPLVEIPTLSHQQGVREINDLVAEQRESYNDRLKQIQTELGQVLTDSPIKDLRKGIGINDRYVFISELFRGDEAMYERSIKTINSFHIFPEAEYWINRELIVKLGWDENSNIVRYFYQLVKRRFS